MHQSVKKVGRIKISKQIPQVLLWRSHGSLNDFTWMWGRRRCNSL